MSIKIVDTELFQQPVAAVINTNQSPPNILSLRKGTAGDHEYKCATYHALKSRIDIIYYVNLRHGTEEEKLRPN